MAGHLRLVLVGLSGVGKSAAGNTILGREEFPSGISSTSWTTRSEERRGERYGRLVTVIDTPGLFNTELSEEQLRAELQRAVSLCEPGPHAFLLVLQLGRFTQQEKRVMETLQELLSKSVDQFTVLLFTHGDRLEDQTIEEFISEDTNLQELLRKCGGRYHVFNNKDMRDTQQVWELFNTVHSMAERNQQEYFDLQNEQDREKRTLSYLLRLFPSDRFRNLLVNIVAGSAIGAVVGTIIGAIMVAAGEAEGGAAKVVSITAVIGAAVGAALGFLVSKKCGVQ
ncbi:GTPase IMAP family member 4-like isoform X2 [Scleropages formosus]|uniref:GTPase IMAP family member 4-like isoform X2 n=1 Tax=Scleropages formosus TaxID=113540 RepID=UPI0010FAB6CD|nr:GTPase IMAP family member 4-like isoform X2 [Scleropages formosus]